MNRNAIIWIPLAVGGAFLILGLALAKYWATLPTWATPVGALVAGVLIVSAVLLAFRRGEGATPKGGSGGRAVAIGDESQATGGAGGEAGAGDGGEGGSAIAKGRRSVARGGSAGKG